MGECIAQGGLSGLGSYSKLCEDWLNRHNQSKNFFVSSATHALEMMALLLDISPGDSVILPAFTFVSSANAFVLRGATVSFADNDEYGNILPSEVERLLTKKTKAVVAVHYAGNSCDMDALSKLCANAGVALCEDAAQAVGSTFKGKALGTIGRFGCYSFHDTKNISSGEGGALISNGSADDQSRIEIIREKGTNRRNFLRGQVDKYTWVDIGSSYLASDMNAAYLWPQLESFNRIQERRLSIWNRYHQELKPVASKKDVRVLETPAWNTGNAHLFALVMPNSAMRDRFIATMSEQGIVCSPHYISLHQSPFIRKHVANTENLRLPNCEHFSECLVRLPMFFNLSDEDQSRVIDASAKVLAAS